MRILTGIRATGSLHLGNLLGAVRPALDLPGSTPGAEGFFFVANLHALTTCKDAASLRAQTFDVVAGWLASGLDPERHVLYLQSDVPEATELAWYLGSCTGVGFLEKGHAYKDAASSGRPVNHGVLYYPVLMAADILLFAADKVPVGRDQVQHVEMARDMAGSFNAAFGEVLVLPEAVVSDEDAVPGSDGRKMSKSYGNTLPLFAPRDTLRKLVMSLKTDSTPVDAPKTLDGTVLGDLYARVAAPDLYDDLASRLLAGGLGWGHAKEALFEALDADLAAGRDAYAALRPDEEGLLSVLRRGAERARSVSDGVMADVRRAAGIVTSRPGRAR